MSYRHASLKKETIVRIYDDHYVKLEICHFVFFTGAMSPVLADYTSVNYAAFPLICMRRKLALYRA